MKIEDNFLDQEEFNYLQSILMGSDLPWYYNPGIVFVPEENKFQFIHLFYDNWAPNTDYIKILNPILIKIEPISLWRIKANLLTKTLNIVENMFHIDIGDGTDERLKQWTTSIFYVNTNNGYTEFEDGTKIECVANRLVSFPANMKHLGTSCTDQKTRVVINFNYFKR